MSNPNADEACVQMTKMTSLKMYLEFIQPLQEQSIIKSDPQSIHCDGVLVKATGFHNHGSGDGM